MEALIDTIQSDHVQIARAEKDKFGKHQVLDKKDVTQSLESKDKLAKISKEFEVYGSLN